jgi:imidazoleglycerol-phosphate dehydratase/histidinol-phosphatase
MSAPLKIVFVDRDGTLVEEPPDKQVDRLDKVRLMPGVIPALCEIRRAGFTLVMVTNQDGLGTPSFPAADFRLTQQFILDLFASQGVHFDAVCVCPHFADDGCDCRKPRLGMVRDYLASRGARQTIDLSTSFVVGDRDTDLEFARALGATGLRVRLNGATEETWEAIARRIVRTPRTALVTRKTRETDIRVDVDLDHEAPVQVRTGIGFLDHMIEQIARHGGFALELQAQGDLHIDEHHTVEDCALAVGAALKAALGDKRGIGRYGFVLPMDEAQAHIAIDLSGRPYAVFEGKFTRERVGELPTELVPHFFRSLAESLGAAIQIEVRGENAHHMIEACFKGVGRALRQAIRREGVELPSSKGVL